MRHRFAPFFAILSLGCIASLLAIPLGYDIAEQRVTGSPLGGLLPAGAFPIPLDVDLAAEAEARDTGPAQHVHLVELRFDVTTSAEGTGDADDLGFIDGIDVYVESSRSGSTLPRIHVAGLASVPDGARAIELALDDVDLIAYVREGARLSATATGTVPPDDVTFDGHYTFAVEFLP